MPARALLREKALSRPRVEAAIPSAGECGAKDQVSQAGARLGEEVRVDLVLKGRGIRITDQTRRVAEHKLAKLERQDLGVRRFEVEIIQENPRIQGGHRVEAACDTARRRFRAHGSGQDVESALDQVVSRLERQIASYRGKLKDRRTGTSGRLESRETSPGGADNQE